MVGTGLECLMKRDAREVRYLAWLAVEYACHRGPASESHVLPDVFRMGLEKKVVEKVAGYRLADRSLFHDKRWIGCGLRNDIGQQLVPGLADVRWRVLLRALLLIGAVLRGSKRWKPCQQADQRKRDQFSAELSDTFRQGFSFGEHYLDRAGARVRARLGAVPPASALTACALTMPRSSSSFFSASWILQGNTSLCQRVACK